MATNIANSMEPLISSVQQMAQQADEAQRKRLIDTLNGLALSIESPQDLMQRLLYLHVYIAVARVACDLQIFNIIVNSPGPITAAEVAERTGAAPRLVARILRYLASVKALAETGTEDTYTANQTTHTLADPAWQGAIYHNFDFAWPCFLALPDFLKETGYKDIEDPTHCPFNKGHNSSETAFEWYPQQPSFPKFNQFMTVQRQGMPTWLDKYPYLDSLRGLGEDQPLFVDVGGGVGHQSAALRDELPEGVKNAIIVQDQESVISQATPKDGIQHMVHDFWTEQPVKGARMYYMRNIMHDWPDDKAATVLRQVRAAMASDSVLLIDDMVVPKTGAHWQATQLDMLMMSVFGACERSESQWESLIASAGLKIQRIYQYTKSLNDSIIECVLS